MSNPRDMCFHCGGEAGDVHHTRCECGFGDCKRSVCDTCRFMPGVFAWPATQEGVDAIKAGKTYEDLAFSGGELKEVSMRCYERMQKENV